MSCFKVPYSKEIIEVNLPGEDHISVIAPRDEEVVTRDEREILEAALDNPVGSPALEKLVNGSSKVAIVVDDLTRSTPTERILPEVLRRLERAGVDDGNISIIFALGTHRKMTAGEEKRLLGTEIWSRYTIIEHDPRDESTLAAVAGPSGVVEFKANKVAVEADLRILIGLIKPHSFAGFTGGAKSVIPGICDLDSIIANHSYRNLAHSKSGIGMVEGNPVRHEMERKVRCLEPNFILNVVLNRQEQIVEAFAGDMVDAHRKGCELADRIFRVSVKAPADIVIAACPHPTDSNLYQALYGAAVATKTQSPIVKQDGIVILVAHCPEGLGDSCFSELVTSHKDPHELLDFISRPGFSMVGQWAAQDWGRVLSRASLIIVSHGGIPEGFYRNNPVKRAATVEEAWQMAKATLKKDKVLGYILPQAPFTLPLVE